MYGVHIYIYIHTRIIWFQFRIVCIYVWSFHYLVLGVDVGPSLDEQGRHLRVTILSSYHQGSRPVLYTYGAIYDVVFLKRSLPTLFLLTPFPASMFAPRFRRISTILRWPHWAAQNNAVNVPYQSNKKDRTETSNYWIQYVHTNTHIYKHIQHILRTLFKLKTKTIEIKKTKILG